MLCINFQSAKPKRSPKSHHPCTIESMKVTTKKSKLYALLKKAREISTEIV